MGFGEPIFRGLALKVICSLQGSKDLGSLAQTVHQFDAWSRHDRVHCASEEESRDDRLRTLPTLGWVQTDRCTKVVLGDCGGVRSIQAGSCASHAVAVEAYLRIPIPRSANSAVSLM